MKIKYLFKNAGVISVDRKSKNKEAMEEGKKRLLNNELVLILVIILLLSQAIVWATLPTVKILVVSKVILT